MSLDKRTTREFDGAEKFSRVARRIFIGQCLASFIGLVLILGSGRSPDIGYGITRLGATFLLSGSSIFALLLARNPLSILRNLWYVYCGYFALALFLQLWYHPFSDYRITILYLGSMLIIGIPLIACLLVIIIRRVRWTESQKDG